MTSRARWLYPLWFVLFGSVAAEAGLHYACQRGLVSQAAIGVVAALQCAGCSLLAAYFLLSEWHRGRAAPASGSIDPKTHLLMGLAFLFEAPADFLYFMRRWVVPSSSNVGAAYTQEICFTIFSFLLAGALFRRTWKQVGTGFRLLLVVLAVYFYATATWDLVKVFPTEAPETYFYFTTAGYGLGEALATGTLFIITLLTLSKGQAVFSLFMLLMMAASIALKSADQDFKRPLMFLDYGWNLGLAGVAATLAWVHVRNDRFKSWFEFAPLVSLRVFVGLGSFLGVMLCAVFIRVSFIQNQATSETGLSPAAFLTSGMITIVIFAWAAANLMALWLSLQTRAFERALVHNESLDTGELGSLAMWEIKALAQTFRRINQSLQDAKREITIQRDEMESVFSGAAHDVRSPLTSLALVERELAGQPEVPAELKELLKLGVARIRSVANELLENRRQYQVIRSPFSLRKTVADIEREVKSLCDQPEYRHIAVRTEVGGGLDYVLADERKLTQALINLMTNALDACRGRTLPTVRLIAKPDERDAEGIELVVSDDGCGIPADALSSIWTLGFTSGKEHGNGLGLNIVKRVVEQHGGSIRVTSTLGVGTTFMIRIPSSILN